MKHLKFILFFGFLLIVCGITNAQTAETFTNSGATITNAGTVNLTYKVKTPVTTLAFQVVNAKTSGTIAGKTYLQASVDGTNYVSIDSLTNTDKTTNSKLFLQNPPGYKFYRFSWTGTGTMAGTSSAYAYIRK